MVGLGSTITGGPGSYGMSSPLDISGCKLWFRHNKGISADLNSSSGAIDHSTDADNMDEGDKIDGWADQSGEDNHAVQDTGGDAPVWVDSSSSVNFAAGKYMDLTGSGISEGSNSNFTFVFRGSAASINTAMAFFGNSTTDFWRFNSGGKVIRTKIGGRAAVDFTESTAIETDVLY